MPMPQRVPELPEDWERRLCAAAHPDDIRYGTASVVARWTAQGKQVTYLLCARGEAGIDAMDPSQAGRCASRRSPTAPPRSGRTPSSSSTTANGAMEYGLPLRRDITRVVRRRPEVVVSGTCDVRLVGGMTNRADHRAAGLATLDAARDAATAGSSPSSSPRAGAVERRAHGLPERLCQPDSSTWTAAAWARSTP